MVSNDSLCIESRFFDGLFAKPWNFPFKQPNAGPLALWPWPKSTQRQVPENKLFMFLLPVAFFPWIFFFFLMPRSLLLPRLSQAHWWGLPRLAKHCKFSTLGSHLEVRWLIRWSPGSGFLVNLSDLGKRNRELLRWLVHFFLKKKHILTGMLWPFLQQESIMTHIALKKYSGEKLSIWGRKKPWKSLNSTHLGHGHTLVF